MPSALIFGGSGKVARHLTRLLVANEYIVYSVIRSDSQVASLKSLGAQPIVQSLETATTLQLASTIRDCNPDVIIWSAGAGARGSVEPGLVQTIDADAAIRSFDATVDAGLTKRYIMLSVLDLRDRQARPVPDWYDENDLAFSEELWSKLPTYMEAKLAADRDLVQGNMRRGLNFTIIRPSWFTDDTGTRLVEAGKVHFGNSITREDTAAVMMACIQEPQTIGLIFDVRNGNTPLKDSIDTVVQDRQNVFEGYY